MRPHVLAIAFLTIGGASCHHPVREDASANGLASVTGIVTDAASGRSVGHAVVRLDPIHSDGNVAADNPSGGSSSTDNSGRFSIGQLSQGDYALTISATSYNSYSTSMRLSGSQARTLNVQLRTTSRCIPTPAFAGQVSKKC